MEQTKSSFACAFIDVQKAFTVGTWRNGLPDEHVAPIKVAFDRCASVLKSLEADVPVAFAKYPFRSSSDTDFDASVETLIPPQSRVVIKPNTNILHDPAFSAWLESQVLSRGIRNLVLGGCTTTSCVRVSSTSVQRQFGKHGLQVWVVLSLCGARLGNYTRRCSDCFQRYMDFATDDTCNLCSSAHPDELLSPVDKAKHDMTEDGVKVVEDWPDEFALRDSPNSNLL